MVRSVLRGPQPARSATPRWPADAGKPTEAVWHGGDDADTAPSWTAAKPSTFGTPDCRDALHVAKGA